MPASGVRPPTFSVVRLCGVVISILSIILGISLYVTVSVTYGNHFGSSYLGLRNFNSDIPIQTALIVSGITVGIGILGVIFHISRFAEAMATSVSSKDFVQNLMFLVILVTMAVGAIFLMVSYRDLIESVESGTPRVMNSLSPIASSTAGFAVLAVILVLIDTFVVAKKRSTLSALAIVETTLLAIPVFIAFGISIYLFFSHPASKSGSSDVVELVVIPSVVLSIVVLLSLVAIASLFF